MTQFPSLRVRNFRTISKPQSVLGKAGDAELPQAETRRRHFDRLVEIGGAQSGCCHLQKYVTTRQSRIETRQWRFRQNRKSESRRVGKAYGSQWRYRWSP